MKKRFLTIAVLLFGVGVVSAQDKFSHAADVRLTPAQRTLFDVQSRLDDAKKLTGDNRILEIDKIIAQLKDIVSRLSQKDMPPNAVQAAQVKLDIYQARFMLADTLGRVSIEPNANQLILWFQDTPDDRRLIKSRTDEAIKLYDDLIFELKDDIRSWRGQMKVWVVKAQQINHLERNIAYMSTWVYLYRAFTLNPAIKEELIEREGLFDDILMILKPFAENDFTQTDSRKYWAMWMMALSYRESGELSEAWELLDPRLYKNCENNIRQQILAERIITFIKQHEFTKAEGELAELNARLIDMPGTSSALQVDMQSAVLKDFLYSTLAANAQDQASGEPYLQMAQMSIIDLLNKYEGSSMQRSILEFFGRKVGNVTDIKLVDSVRLLAKAEAAVDAGEFQPAEAIYDTILSRNDKSSVVLYPRALWGLGMLMYRQQLYIRAAAYFTRIAAEYPDYHNLIQAAEYAAISINAEVSECEKNGNITLKLRLDCVKAIELLLELASRDPQYPFDRWYFRLGELYDKLSRESENKQRWGRWLESGIAALAKVPDKPEFNKIQARNMSLGMRYRTLGSIDAPSLLAAQAEELRKQFSQLANDAQVQMKLTDDAARITYLENVAAWAELYAAMLLADELGHKELVFVELEKLSQKWPQVSDMLMTAKQYEIRKLVEEGRIDKAIVHLNDYRRHNADLSSELISLVIIEIRKKIESLEEKPQQKLKLADYRSAYLEFAQQLYKTADGDGEHLRDVALIYVDAMNQNSRGKEVFDLILDVKAEDDARHRAEIQNIEKKYKQKIAHVDKASDDKGRLLGCVDEFAVEAHKAGFSLENNFIQLRSYKGLLMQARPQDEDFSKLLVNTSRELKKVIGDLCENEKNMVGYDVNVYLNLARCCRAAGQSEQAVDYYNRITGGLDVSNQENARLFWKLEYELCKSIVDSLAKDPAWKDAALLRINQLRERDVEMGGFSAEFGSLKQILQKTR